MGQWGLVNEVKCIYHRGRNFICHTKRYDGRV